MPRRSPRSGSLTALAAALAFLAAPAIVRAQPKKAPPASAADLAKAKEHFAKGKELFDKKDFKGAVGEFKESYRLSHNPLLLYNIGYTLDQMGDKSLALFYYQKYEQDSPPSDSNRKPAHERITVLSKEIEEQPLGGGPGPATPPTTPTQPPPATGPTTPTTPPAQPPPNQPVVDRFQHNVIDEAPPGKPIDVGCFVPPGKNWQVALYYRAAGEGTFTRVDMKPRYNELIGRIPAVKTLGANVQYYIEVKDASGKLIDRSGKQTSPHLVLVDKDARPHYYADLGDESVTPQAAAAAAAAAPPPSTGGGSVAELRGDETVTGTGWLDAGSSKYRKLTWAATGAAAAFFIAAGSFYYISGQAASDLESEAKSSRDPTGCGTTAPPCHTFSDKQQSLEGRGQRFETFGTVTLAIGGVAAVGAGVLWFLEWRHHRRAAHHTTALEQLTGGGRLDAAPVVSDHFFGGAAVLSF